MCTKKGENHLSLADAAEKFAKFENNIKSTMPERGKMLLDPK
jgi:hypothetical protein